MLKNALTPSRANKYKKHKARKPLHERKTSLEIPIKMGAVIAVAQARKCTLKEAANVLKYALQNAWVLQQQEILSIVCANPRHVFSFQDEQDIEGLTYDENELI